MIGYNLVVPGPGYTADGVRIVYSLYQIENELFPVAPANKIDLRALQLDQLCIE